MVERGRSAVECQNLKQERSCSNPFATVSKLRHFLFFLQCPNSLNCLNEYLAIDGGGNVSE